MEANSDIVKKLIAKIGRWAIVGLSEPASIGGSGYGGKIRPNNAKWSMNRFGHYLCAS